MAQSLAERFRKAREAFEAGLEMGCSPRDAMARKRWQESDRRLKARMAQMDCSPREAVTREVEQPAFWFKQGDMA